MAKGFLSRKKLIVYLRKFYTKPLVYINKIVERKLVDIFLPVSFKISVFDAQKNSLIETVLLNTCNTCFG